mmetsp:Transcript_13286/g.52960  ORF Transcript_13286/g.52960 Transcript_13286/m.52960 type:complete len:106 (+) Transcript_13286:313-630(+)
MAQVNAKKRTALLELCACIEWYSDDVGRQYLVAALVEAGASPHRLDSDRWSPLRTALMRRCKDSILYLLSIGVDPKEAEGLHERELLYFETVLTEKVGTASKAAM